MGRSGSPRIVVVSGRHFEKDRQAAFKAGADEYVTKPIRTKELFNTIEAVYRVAERLNDTAPTALEAAEGN